MKLLFQKLCKLLKIHDSHHDSALEYRFKKYFLRTKEKTCEFESQWTFFELLEEGGKLFRSDLLEPRTKLGETIQILSRSKEFMAKIKICSHCGASGDFSCWQGCFLHSTALSFAKMKAGAQDIRMIA